MKLNCLMSFLLSVTTFLSSGCVTGGAGQVVTKGSFVFVNPDFASTAAVLKERGDRLRANRSKNTSQDLAGVKIYYKQDAPEGAKDVAVVEAFGRGYSVSIQDLFGELQAQAYLAGANGIRAIEPTRIDESGSVMHATAIAIFTTQPTVETRDEK